MARADSLPVDSLLPQIVAVLLDQRRLVMTASPGTGKTTRVPPALLDCLPDGEVLVLEPRRLAAHLAAARVAQERGGALGEEVGVQVRQGSVCGPATRLRYVTEGVLLRRILEQPELPGVRAVLLDEFHERHLLGDLVLGLLVRLAARQRPDLVLGVLSATLEGAPVAAFLGGCPVLESAGRLHPVEIRHLPEPPSRSLAEEVRGALLRRLAEEAGAPDAPAAGSDVLVFLPGAAEIRRCQQVLAETAEARGLEVLPLHGDLPLPAQQQAVQPRVGGRRRVILSTNVAETSVTIQGVGIVIDSGLARVARHSPWSGLPMLRVQKICRASAAQRAGRAGRTGPGVCLRLYTRADHDARPAFEEPEIRRADLAEAVLLLRRAGLRLQDLPLLDPPPGAAVEAAEELLRVLGALDDSGELTPRGAQMAALPLHPRQARLLIEGQARGVGAEAAVVVALLGERDLRLGQRFGAGREAAPASGPSDLLAMLEAYQEARRLRFDPDRLRAAGLDPWAARMAHRLAAELVPESRAGGPDATPARDEALLRAVLAAYPDRVARRRAPCSDELLLCSGGSAWLAPGSEVREAEFLVAVDVEERTGASGRTIVRLASAIRPDWLLDVEGAPLCERETPWWNAGEGRVEVVWRLLYDRLVLDESRAPARGADPAQWGILLSAVRALGPRALMEEEVLARLQARLAFVATHCPEGGLSPLPADAFDRALGQLCPGRTSLAELRQEPWPEALLAACGMDPVTTLRQLAELAPEQAVLPGGRRVRIHYALGRLPWIESRLQDFFGAERGPSVARGRVPLVLHLLAPNQRPVQVTSDLAGFWEKHYPSVRRELCRRYPRHPWPEDPRAALPPRRRPP